MRRTVKNSPASFGISITGNNVAYWAAYGEVSGNIRDNTKTKANTLQYSPSSRFKLVEHLNDVIRAPSRSTNIFFYTLAICVLLTLLLMLIPQLDCMVIVFAIFSVLISGAYLGVNTRKSESLQKSVNIRYKLDSKASTQYEKLLNGISQLSAAEKLWQVTSSSTSSPRIPVRIHIATPPYLALNLSPYAIVMEKVTLFFLPDCILIYRDRCYSSYPYSASLTVSVSAVSYTEEGRVPIDAVVVGQSWRFARKDGGRDLRYKNNWQITFVEYGQVEFGVLGGQKISLLVSNRLYAYKFVNVLTDYIDYLSGRVKPPPNTSQKQSNSETSHKQHTSYQHSGTRAEQQNSGSYSSSNTSNSSRWSNKESTRENNAGTGSTFSGNRQQNSSQYTHRERVRTDSNSEKTLDPYSILKVSPSATKEEITAAYRKLVQQYHPDKVAHLGKEFQDLAETKMKEINVAYEQLKRR